MYDVAPVRTRRPAKRRLWITLWLVLYALLYVYIYKSWGSPVFSYFGLYDREVSVDPLYVALALTGAVSFLLPLQITSVSQFLGWMIYVITFLPASLTVAMQGQENVNPYLLVPLMSISMGLILLIPRLWVGQKIRLAGMSRSIFWQLFMAAFFLIAAALLYFYRGRINFAAFGDVYTQRSVASEADVPTIVSYMLPNLAMAFCPFLIATGIFVRRLRWMIILGTAGVILAYSTLALKFMLVGGLATIALGFFGRDRMGMVSPPKIAFAAAAAMVVVTGLLFATGFYPTGISLELAALIFLRSFAIQGAMVGTYADFFASNPITYYSHSNIFGFFMPYPYDLSVGYMVGIHLVGGGGFNANSGLFADGIAAWGMPGVVIIGAVVGLLLSIFDRLVPRESVSFACVSMVPFVMGLTNGPLTQMITTGGGLLLAAFFAVGPTMQELPLPYRPHRQMPQQHR